MPPAVTPREFLQTIWGDQVGFAELTTIAPKNSKNFKPGQIDAQPFLYPDELPQLLISAGNKNSRDLNVYMGCALRREKWPRPTGRVDAQGKPEMEWRGTEANALCTRIVWVDLDFEGLGHKGRVVNEDATRKALAEFPIKPSIIVKSGGGIHVYWLLREAAVGAELWTAKKVNRALGKFFGGDPIGDMARILRVPGTGNYNRIPAVNASVSWWHPEFEYVLDDFDFLPVPDDSPAPSSAPQPAQASPASGPPAAPKDLGDGDHGDPRPTPTLVLNEETIQAVGKLFGDIWFEGWRHEMALCVSGWLAFAGVKYENTIEIVRVASDKVGGDTQKRLKDVESTYRKFVQGSEVKGRPTLESMIKEAFPPLSKDKAVKVLDSIQKLLPRPKGLANRGFIEPDFKILWLVKYTSSPPVWTVTLEKDGQRLVTKTEHSRFMKYEVFVEDVCDQNTIVPQAALKNPQWRAMINEARRNGLYEEKQAPEELRFGGAIESGLQEFLAEAHYNPDLGILKKFPGHDDECTFFLLETFRSFLKDRGHSFTQNQITEKLRASTWESRVRRFGKKTPHVWIKALLKNATDEGGNGNGSGNGNGHGPKPDPSLELPDSRDLFPKGTPDE